MLSVKWMRTSHRRKYFTIGAFCCTLLLLLETWNRHPFEGHHSAHVDPDVLRQPYIEFWSNFYSLILRNDPRCENKPVVDLSEKRPRQGFKPDHDPGRQDLTSIGQADLSRLKSTHATFVDGIRTATLVYHPGTQGIVVTSSEEYLITLVLSISMLRKTGSRLPVEVFLDKQSPFLNDYCLKILRPLDARCRFFSDVFVGGAIMKPHKYQYKILAIIFSSFEEVMFLDFDAWPVSRPDSLLSSFPFNITGMVLWPDFWYPSESRYFFEIAGIDPIPALNASSTTESGIMLYNKRQHSQSLMLSTYYNFYGPDYYYPLQAQGSDGEGDKETYGLAAAALKEDFYLVKRQVEALGRIDSRDEFIGIGMSQYNPTEDFLHSTATNQAKLQDDNRIESKHQVSLMFVHANFPKVNPYIIFDQEDQHYKPLKDVNGTWVRMWGPRESTVEKFGSDLERDFWKTIRSVTCETLRGIGLPGVNHAEGMHLIEQRDQRVCAIMDEYLDSVFGSEIMEGGAQLPPSEA